MFKKREKPDWEEIYWRLKYYWPHEEAFCRTNFRYQTIGYVDIALKKGMEFEKERLAEEEKAIAFLHYRYLQAHLDKGKQVDVDDLRLHKINPVQEELSHRVANTIRATTSTATTPEWLWHYLPHNHIQSRLKGKDTLFPRLWLDAEGKDVGIYAPNTQDGVLLVGLAIILHGVYGRRLVRCVDTKEEYLIEIPKQEAENVWIYNSEEIKIIG